MKKIFSIFLSAVLMISCFAIAPSADTADVPFEYPLTPVFTDAFANTSNFKITQKAATGDENVASIGVVTDTTPGYGSALKMELVNKNIGWYEMDVNPQAIRYSLSDYDFADVLALSIDVKVEKMAEQQLALSFNYKDADNKDAGFGIYFNPGGTISFSNTDENVSYETGKWYNVSLVVNKTKNTMYALIDGVVKYSANYTQLANPLHFGNTTSSFYVEPLMIGNKADADNVVYIDNYRTYYGEYPETNYVKENKFNMTCVTPYSAENTNITKGPTSTDTTTFADDAKYGTVGKMSVTSNGTTTKNTQFYAQKQRFHNTPANPNAFGYEVDINTGDAKYTGCTQDVLLRLDYRTTAGNPCPDIFKMNFGPQNGTISIAKTMNGVATTEWRQIMLTPNTWYNFKAFFDFKNSQLMLLVNDIIYSIIPFAQLGNSAPTRNDITTTDTSKYNFMAVTFYSDEAEERFIYVDNLNFYRGTVPNIAFTAPEYTKDAVVITSRDELAGATTLGIKVTLPNNGKNVYVIANVLSGDGRMVAVKLENVLFNSYEVQKEVNLIVDNLPSDIASGDYTINVMIWDNQTLESITTSKITMPDEAPTE